MPPKGYFAAPDLAAQKEMWQQAAKAPKDERGVAIDLAAQREATAREERGDKETTVSSLERAGAGLGLKERLAQL